MALLSVVGREIGLEGLGKKVGGGGGREEEDNALTFTVGSVECEGGLGGGWFIKVSYLRVLFCVKEGRVGRRGRKIRHLTTAFLASFSGATASSQKKKKLPDLGVVREGRGLQFRARCLSFEISSSFVNCGFLFSSHVLSGKIKQIDNETSPAIPNAQLLFFL